MWEGKIFCSYTLTRLLTKSVSWPIISMNFIQTCRNRVNMVRARQVGGRYIDSWEDHGSIVILGIVAGERVQDEDLDLLHSVHSLRAVTSLLMVVVFISMRSCPVLLHSLISDRRPQRSPPPLGWSLSGHCWWLHKGATCNVVFIIVLLIYISRLIPCLHYISLQVPGVVRRNQQNSDKYVKCLTLLLWPSTRSNQSTNYYL